VYTNKGNHQEDRDMAKKRQWERGELDNLKRKFPGARWRMSKGEAIGRMGRLFYIRASWSPPAWTEERFVVSFETRNMEQIALHVSARHRDATLRMQNTFRFFIGTLAEALPSDKRATWHK
jgi:hypothetical protein